MNKDSFFKEPDVHLIMKCSACGEILLFNLDKCKYCGVPIDKDEAIQSAAILTFINRAIALANTIQTGSSAGAMLAMSAVFLYIERWKTLFVLCVLVPSAIVCFAVIRWGYKYGDLHCSEPEFIKARRKMKLHLNFWLALLAVQILVLIIWW